MPSCSGRTSSEWPGSSGYPGLLTTSRASPQFSRPDVWAAGDSTRGMSSRFRVLPEDTPPQSFWNAEQGLVRMVVWTLCSGILRFISAELTVQQKFFKKGKSPSMIFLESILVTSYSDSLWLPSCFQSPVPVLTSLGVGDDTSATQSVPPPTIAYTFMQTRIHPSTECSGSAYHVPALL